MKKPDKRNDVTALDKAIFHLVEKNAFEICLIGVNKYRELGIVNGLATKVGDYYVPYNVLLAIIAQLPCEPSIFEFFKLPLMYILTGLPALQFSDSQRYILFIRLPV